MTQAFNIDCMEYMKTVPDKYFDLAVVDPPYGSGEAADTHTHTAKYNRFGGIFDRYKTLAQPMGGADTQDKSTTCRNRADRERERESWSRFGERFDRYKADGDSDGRNVGGEVRKKIIAWDVAPEQEYFDELFRVSRNQIIWGGNYFALPPTRCFLIWEKTNVPENFSMAMAEYAWTSFNANAKIFRFSAVGQYGRFHPTQKPPELYNWIFANYTKPGMKILDTHLGSGSSRIAAHDAGLDFVGCEIDEYYFKKQEERFELHTAQQSLFVDGGDTEQISVF